MNDNFVINENRGMFPNPLSLSLTHTHTHTYTTLYIVHIIHMALTYIEAFT